MVDVVVYWLTADRETIRRIRHRFGMPDYTTVNGETPASIKDEDMELLRETEKRGYLSIRNKKWCKNGDRFSIIS